MCLAIFKPGKISIPEDTLKAGWQHNPDGAGFAYVKKGKVECVKGLMTLSDFMATYEDKFKHNRSSPFLIHFRIRSMGDKSVGNTHPFEIPNGAMIHNGTIDGTDAKYGTGPSDTVKFVQAFGDKLNFNFVKEHKKELEFALGRQNKLAFLFSDKTYQIVNAEQGIWENDVWYSNRSYVPYPTYK